MEKFLREWRQDAVNKHQYDSAIFIGDKCLALTNDPNDAFFLAQIHFSTGHYTRAQTFLNNTNLIAKSSPCRYLYALTLIKQNKHEEALTILGEKSAPNVHTHHTRRRGATRSNDDKYEAAMCYLRGLVYAKQNAFDRAKDCYKEAVRIDVKCFEAFDQLMRNNLMSPDEEWSFLEELDFDSMSNHIGGSTGESTAEFVKMLYTTRLSKYKNAEQFDSALTKLSTHYPLAKNPDLLLSKAELLFTQCRFKECCDLAEMLLENDKYNFKVYPTYLACLHELGEKNKIFLVSHNLADNHPDEPCTWLAVGVYYLTIGRIAEARRFFSKSSMMDPHFGPAWIGFAHTFAAEGEHDQAISAYSTAARLFQGTHLPQLFLGMQHLQLNNISLADEYLQTAYQLCRTDPLLLNELGVVFFHNDSLNEAIKLFNKALRIAMEIDCTPKSWIATRANLGHAYRRLGRYKEARKEFSEVLRCGGPDANVRCALGLVCMMEGKSWEAVTHFHEALAISPQDPIASELLEQALQQSSEVTFNPIVLAPNGGISIQDDDDVDAIIENRASARDNALSESDSSNIAPPTINAPANNNNDNDDYGDDQDRRRVRNDLMNAGGGGGGGGAAGRRRRQLGDVTERYMQSTPSRSIGNNASGGGGGVSTPTGTRGGGGGVIEEEEESMMDVSDEDL